MTTADLEVTPSGPPPVATRHDHQGLKGTDSPRP